jgi:predicted AAA+ superfamily ATPase
MQLETNIVKNAKVSPSLLEHRLTDPIRGIAYPHRNEYDYLTGYIKNFCSSGTEPRMIALAGLRGVGKTTLMWQLAKYTYQNLSKNIYQFNVNILSSNGISLFELMETFQNEVLNCRFNEYSEPIFLLFDEVHDDDNWQKTLKIIYDECRTAFVISTGSSALLINQSADLASRMKINRIYPFNFTEYVKAKTVFEKQKLCAPENLSANLIESLFYSEDYNHLKANFIKFNLEQKILNYQNQLKSIFNKNITEIIREYVIYRNIPRYSLYFKTSDIDQSVLELVKRIIYEDVVKINPKYTGLQFEKLMYRLSASDEINLDKLSQTLGLKKEDIEYALDAFDKAELLNIINPNSISIDALLTKNKKAFFMSPSVRIALLSAIYGDNIPDSASSKIWEDIVMMYLCRIVSKSMISFSAEKSSVNPDFIIETRDCPIVVEVGTKKTTTKQLSKYRQKIRYGILINAGDTEIEFNDKNKTLILPMSWFLMI